MGGDDEFVLLSCEGISSKVDLDSKWHARLQKFRDVENLFLNQDVRDSSMKPTFTVPRIVVIGEESSGKSSTLERIAMMQFFPTDRTICTRMPIELRLRYRSSKEIKEVYESMNGVVYESYVKMSIKPSINSTLPSIPDVIFPPHEAASKIKEWMDLFITQGNGSVSGILKDVLVIELNSTRKLNLDLIDLPGIVGASLAGEPSDMMVQTRQLAESFVNDPLNPHCLIVCVVSSRTERVRNSQAMEIIQRYNKTGNTIGVLTMIDLCKDTYRNPNDPFWELKERLGGTSKDMPSLEHGYVALKNRDTIQQQLLVDVNKSELDWLRENLPDLAAQMSIDSKNSVGIDALIKKLLYMLDSYTETKWAPEELQRLHDEQANTNEKLKLLGPIMSSFSDLTKVVYNKIVEQSSLIYSYDNIQKVCVSFSIPKPAAVYATKEFFDEKVVNMKKIKLSVSQAVHDCIVKPVSQIVDIIFDDVSNPSIIPSQQLQRFSKLRFTLDKLLLEWALETKEKITKNIWQFIELTYVSTNGSNIGFISTPGGMGILGISSIEIVSSKTVLDFVMTELLMNPLSDYLLPPEVKPTLSTSAKTPTFSFPTTNGTIDLGFNAANSTTGTFMFDAPPARFDSDPFVWIRSFNQKLIRAYMDLNVGETEPKTIEAVLLTEDCSAVREQLKNRVIALESMIQVILTEIPHVSRPITTNDFNPGLSPWKVLLKLKAKRP